MKISSCYPKIPDSSAFPLKQCIMFEKYDGTNIHWLWRGNFIEFGVRRHRYSLDDQGTAEFNREHPELTGIIDTFDALLRATQSYLQSQYPDCEVVLFSEYLGSKSFAGQHVNDDEKKLVLFDCAINGKLMPPERFLSEFAGRAPTARVLYRGPYNGTISDNVRQGKYGVNEGVVIKGEKNGEVLMAKIKTNDYQQRLKVRFGANWTEFWE